MKKKQLALGRGARVLAFTSAIATPHYLLLFEQNSEASHYSIAQQCSNCAGW